MKNRKFLSVFLALVSMACAMASGDYIFNGSGGGLITGEDGSGKVFADRTDITDRKPDSGRRKRLIGNPIRDAGRGVADGGCMCRGNWVLEQDTMNCRVLRECYPE